MGEVGTNSADSPHADLKMNGGINGNCDDEAMDVDAQDTPTQPIAKNADSSSDKPATPTPTVTDSDNVMEVDTSGNSDGVELITSENDIGKESVETKAHENGAADTNDEKCDSKESIKETVSDDALTEEPAVAEDDSESDKLVEDSDSTVKVSSDPLSADAEPIDDDKRTNQSRPQSTENGTSATITSSDDKKDIDKAQSKGSIRIDDDDEIHAISDSDEDDVQEKPAENPLKGIEDKTLSGSQSNGIGLDEDGDEGDEDKPVSIHSDSDSDSELPSKDEVHEILSDKEDCVVIEDEKKLDDSDLTVRAVNRNRKSTVRPREDYSAYDDDIEEIIEDPLEQSAPKRPRLTDPLASESRKLQVPSNNSSTSKEPTLVIIDTNTILSRGTAANVQALNKSNVSVTPVVGVPAQGIYPIESRASITPVPNNNQVIATGTSTTLAGLNAPVLTALTDDMFVLEAPSFIVPYIYEKPPSEDLKEIVLKMGVEIEERKKLEASNDKGEPEPAEDAKDEEKSETEEATTEKKPTKKRKPPKNGDDSWDESDMSTDDEGDSDVEDTKVLIKEAKADLDSIKTHIIHRDLTKDPTCLSDDKKDGNNYFDSPLGKFFMDIGINLVQEHVQTDLLRQQKRKLNREGNQASPSVQVAINSLMKNLELSKGKNDVFKFETKRCEYCNFKSESSLVMAHHYETPHMKGSLYKCNFCAYEVKPPYDILLHMKTVHNIQARLEKAASYHQCPNCLFEDNGRSKLARHAVVCSKKFRPELNLAPPVDWDPPAKIPRIKPRHGLVGTANAYQAMAAQAQRAATAAMQRQTTMNVNAAAVAAMNKNNRGRPQTITKVMPTANNNMRAAQQQAVRPQIPGGVVLPNNFQVSNPGQYNIQPTGSKTTQKTSQQPSISITALPRQTQPTSIHSTTASLSAANAMQSTSILPKPSGAAAAVKPGQNQGGKASFVICEICDGWIKDLDQLRNHMQWMHKVKIHPKMIYNRPPLNCQKCQFRFFTDQGLERHLLGSHGLVTSSMQEAANKGKDAGRCPVCGRMYQWKLLNHVSREHNMTLKPAHLSYKCTVCTATFGMYKQFENHVYSAHSTVAKKSNDSKSKASSASSSSGGGGGSMGNSSRSSLMAPGTGASILKNQPFKINDEITITPQPASRNNRPIEIESHIID
ncbi:uncharacterized protein LOC129579280 isoform X2 [Sitodiplosis mosellana]|uniref:uncharacterized protein LOC129579280 isoform X2 n=1 Tax=Sitodiplosis mosellana TaxID=263140 RepID=UPI002443E1A0|nr:uncharacterized protein LOC129579280 isoform X2 [Sitodiplosis mosellana]XP_055325171.1 uncharacterized protein LOC129579280 isoform X2 [Sitodiplosis mosellana]XP_055325172.1 uncharacterized protein LOC129579280 isoform X2 [Sitodiplosis mosellana]XP_055325173.1 uncharacterized protein LOC129579280 isoform X2 [Sitodiplosis mosellana]XP_055325174.1 uncharacterized protein LOC129579280 isoform X2 [Sitodiplosis mosellana]XP_055325175.1 uncharacterized protein LOC129579280 isoform X2 [Sitodiplosi